MPRADQVLALVRSHFEGDPERFKTIALQLAAHEARNGHETLAREMRDLIAQFDAHNAVFEPARTTVHIAKPRGELANLVSATFPNTQVSQLELSSALAGRLSRILEEQFHVALLRENGLRARRKILLVGPPGTGKTMTASALAGQLRLPLLTILLEAVITRYMGDSATKLRIVFDAMAKTRAVFLFDEFDAIGAKRTTMNDVGEIRRILNSFLQFLENDVSDSIIICATNHPEMLDRALFRRFDDVLEYSLPEPESSIHLLRSRLASFDLGKIRWDAIAERLRGLSQAEIVRAADEAAKTVVLIGERTIHTEALDQAIAERHNPAR